MKRKLIVFVCVMSAVMLMFSMFSFADFGNADGDDWGGDSWGGDNWGGDSWGDDSWSGGDNFIFLGNGGEMSIPGVIIFIIIVIIVVVKSKGGSSATDPHSRQVQRVADRDYASIDSAVIAKIRTVDPAFSPEDFKTYAGDVYIRAQESWEEKNLAVLRPYISDKYYNNINSLLKEFIDGKKTNHLDGQCISETYLTGFVQTEKYELLTVRLRATMLDYVTSDENGSILAGSSTTRQTRYYKLEFMRTSGLKTSTEKKMSAMECPNCGAPIQVTSAGVCEYCKSVVTSGEYSWVLNNYTLWRD